MSEQETLANSLKEVTINDNNDNKPVKKLASKKPKAAYDVVALKERWKILGTDPEQSKASKIIISMSHQKA
jgi:hypothetical protein